MTIQCNCGNFRARLLAYPKNTPGRLMCYCDDCQTFLFYLKRQELLDANGGTEIVPAYPADVLIDSGAEHLRCTQLTSKGMYRFATSCCGTPIANTRPGMPWIGFYRCVYVAADRNEPDRSLGPIRSRIMGSFARGKLPPNTPASFGWRSFLTVIPFILKGKLLQKFKRSPFFKQDGKTPIAPCLILSEQEFTLARKSAGFT